MDSQPTIPVSSAAEVRHRVLLFVAAVVLGAAAIGWWATASANVPLLTPRGDGQWIVFPLSPVARPRMFADLPATFRQRLELGRVPRNAQVRLRAMRQFRLIVNGQRIGESSLRSQWKQTFTFDIAPHLRQGENRVEILVRNDLGPPALWLVLNADDGSTLLVSDTQWGVSLAGSHWAPARAASDFPKGGLIDPQRRPMRVSEIWPGTLVAVLVFGGIVFAAVRRFVGIHRLTTRLLLIATVVLWGAIFVNNAGVLSQMTGYDSTEHLKYVQHLLDHHRLPRADQGFQTNQPPLYYVVAAASLAVCNMQTTDPGAAYVLRAVGLVAGVVHVVVILALLRLIFPDERRRVLTGWLVAAALPVHLYLFQYVTNEWLFATLATVALYLGAGMATKDRYDWCRVVILGICFGACLLTKLTAVIPIGVITAMLGLSLAQRKQRDVRVWLRALVIPIVIAVALGGWHYARTMSQTGSAFVTSNDRSSGYIWWQDPGYTTPPFFLRFGEVFVEPFYSGFSGFPDGVYSTLFGDSMFGATATQAAPGWNYTLIMTCYVLSVLPMLALMVGAAACARSVVRRPDAVHLAMLALPGLMLAAMVMFSLRVSNYGCSKVFYGLCAAGPCCILAAWGLDIFMRRGRVIGAVVCVMLTAWAISAYGSFWILRTSPRTSNNLAATAARQQRVDDATSILRRTVQRHPSDTDARIGLITLLGQTGRGDEALQQSQDMIRQDPGNADAHWAAGWLLDRAKQPAPAIKYARQAVALSPHHPKALLLLAELYEQVGQVDQAVEIYRRTLMRDPDDRFTHKALARLYEHAGQVGRAAFHAHLAKMMDEHMRYHPWSH